MNLSSSLVSLSLAFTRLQGNLSSDILSLPNLQKLDLLGNGDLSGQLPKSNWSTPLRYLDLSLITVSGEIPNSIGHLKFLTQLQLMKCKFDGLVPLSLWNLTQLTHLDLSLNKLKGEISSLFSNLVYLTDLDLQQNNFTGLIPNVFHNLPQLSYLDSSFNKLVGPIPIETGKLTKLSIVGLNSNMLNGTIPHWCFSLSSLLVLHLRDNQLTGSIGELKSYSLQYLLLSNNNLQGHFPKSIFELQNLTYLTLSSTNLSGVVDFHQFSKLKNLQFLNLSHNSFLSINNDSSANSIFPSLESFYLSSTNINSFPKFLAQRSDMALITTFMGKFRNGFIRKS